MSLLLQVTIFLGAALILVPLGNRLGIASILGYLFTGILLGPSVLNIAHDPDAIMELAEFGVIMLMFLIGLELRPQRLWEMRHSMFVMGGLQMLLSGIVLMLGVFLLLNTTPSASFILGFALALSSTAFVLQMLSEQQQLNTVYGRQAFAILLFQDMAAIPLLAAVPLLAGSGSTHHGIAYFAAIVAAFTGLFLFSRYVMRPFFRFVAKSGATELITAVGLFIVLAVVLLMETLGISTTLGAFLTGMLLADSEFRHELEASIAPFKGLLLGLFFMTVGMTTQLHLVLDNPELIVGSALLLMLVKAALLVGIARYYRRSWRNSLLLATCLAQGGEFAFVVLTVAHTEKVLSTVLFEPAMLIVTLSMMLTPLSYWAMHKLLSRWNTGSTRPDDSIPTTQHPIIIAGFGRFGQIVARVARLQHIPFTAIDNNPQHQHFVHQYGGSLYYGDATHPDLLRSAGIQHAKVFVLAIDDVEDSMNVARHIKLNYPSLKLLVRARDRHHVHLLREIGVQLIWRETYLSSLGMAFQVLRELDVPEQQAYDNIERFRDYDEKLLAQQQSIFMDPEKIHESQRNALLELEQLFEYDREISTSSTGVNLTRGLENHRIDVTRDEPN